ncbi:MAG: cephalosporin hydroxylase family protein [Bacteroidetes bacterium]|nr:cephalosporin hydroxylase family protein [Bacteroidota bacterium]
MNQVQQFEHEREERVASNGTNEPLQQSAKAFMTQTIRSQYSYNFSWMGRPIIAYPQDMIAMQELIWRVQPDLIIEAGVAHGGSVIYYASLLELIGGDGLVVGIDIDIRKHNRDLIEQHPMMKRIQLIEGSSVSDEVVNQVKQIAAGKKKIMVCLDSNHTHEHVLAELKCYAPLVSVDSYCVVFDTVVEDMPEDLEWANRPWGIGDNPKTAVFEYLKEDSNFEIDKSVDYKLLISVAPDGYLRRTK